LGDIGRIEEAIKCLDKVIEINNDDAYAWYLKGKMLKKLGEYKEALKCLYTAVGLNKDWINAYKDIGYLELIFGNYEDALNYLDKYLEKYPEDFEAKYYKAQIYENMNKLEEALGIYDEIISKLKDGSFILRNSLINKARILEKLGRIEEAIEIYNKAIGENKNIE